MTRLADKSAEWKTINPNDYGPDETTHVSVGTSCEIYSRSNNKWCAGHIVEIYVDPQTKLRWLTVSYKNNTKLKKIQRFSKNLRFTETSPSHRAIHPKQILNLQNQLTEISINVEIYKQNGTNCSCPTHATGRTIITQCDYLQRLFHALQHYHSLHISDNTANSDIFTTFCDDIYTQFTNDWVHFISSHAHQTRDISAELIANHSFPTRITKESPIITRHYRHPSPVQSTTKDGSADCTRFTLYRQMMDDAFFYVFYLHELGLRITTESDVHDTDDMKHDAYDSMDYAFGKKKQMVINKRRQYALTNKRGRFTHTAIVSSFSYYKGDERYVAPKYDTFKEEILSHMRKAQFDHVELKAQLYSKTEKVKQYNCQRQNDLHFDQRHLISLIIYCDFDALSGAFRASFDTAERHSAYHFVARYLQEAVECYGVQGRGTWDAQRFEYVNPSHGPFYCAVDCVECLDSLWIEPMSTTKRIEIALHNGVSSGMIMQLNQCDGEEMRWFECGWISRYAEEEECLFTNNRLRIESVLIVDRNQSFAVYLNAIYVFDCMINSNRVHVDMDVTATDVFIMTQLMSQNNDFDEFMNETFRLFCAAKTDIVLNIDYLNEHCFAMYHLVVQSIHSEDRDEYEYDAYSEHNVVQRCIFELFQNVQTITIHSTDWLGTSCYAFSLSKFLGIISGCGGCNWTEIKIKAVCQSNIYDDVPQPSWISMLWCSSASHCVAQYRDYGFNIAKQNRMTINAEGRKEQTLIITKL
eukprot:555564_1